MICVRFTASNGRGSLETTIVLPGNKIFFEGKRLFLINCDLPSGNMTKILSLSAEFLSPLKGL